MVLKGYLFQQYFYEMLQINYLSFVLDHWFLIQQHEQPIHYSRQYSHFQHLKLIHQLLLLIIDQQ